MYKKQTRNYSKSGTDEICLEKRYGCQTSGNVIKEIKAPREGKKKNNTLEKGKSTSNGGIQCNGTQKT